MKLTPEEIKELAGKSWEKVNTELYDSGGVNPYAYLLGFKAGFNETISVAQARIAELEQLVKIQMDVGCQLEKQNAVYREALENIKNECKSGNHHALYEINKVAEQALNQKEGK